MTMSNAGVPNLMGILCMQWQVKAELLAKMPPRQCSTVLLRLTWPAPLREHKACAAKGKALRWVTQKPQVPLRVPGARGPPPNTTERRPPA